MLVVDIVCVKMESGWKRRIIFRKDLSILVSFVFFVSLKFDFVVCSDRQACERACQFQNGT